jgi:hypothetical protein
MPAYFIAEIELTNPAEYEPYRVAVPLRSRSMAAAT